MQVTLELEDTEMNDPFVDVLTLCTDVQDNDAHMCLNLERGLYGCDPRLTQALAF